MIASSFLPQNSPINFLHVRNVLAKLDLYFIRKCSVAYPHFIYGILTWGSTNNSGLNSLQVLQNRLVRITSRVRKSDHIVASNSLYHKLNLLKTKDVYLLEMVKFM